MLNNKNFDASKTNWIGLWTLFSKETTRFLDNINIIVLLQLCVFREDEFNI